MGNASSKLISDKMTRYIISYYLELNNKNKMEGAKDICANLGISIRTHERFINAIIFCKDDSLYSKKIYDIVMLHTIFLKGYEPYELQQQVIKEKEENRLKRKQAFVKAMMKGRVK